MISKFRNWAIGKSLSYWDNATKDAILSNELLDCLRHDRRASKDKSINNFLGGQPDRIVVYAYTLYFVNGYMDHTAAKLFGYLGGISDKLITNHYKNAKFIHLLDWARPLWGDCRGIEVFAAQSDLQINLTPSEILKNIKYVQEVNIKRNKDTIETIRYSSHKLMQQYGIVEKKFNPDEITTSYISTQNRAIYWDRLYIILIDLRSKKSTY